MSSLFDTPVDNPGQPTLPGIPVGYGFKPVGKSTKPETPGWLKRHLQNEGLVDFSKDGPPATAKTQSIWCPNCHRPIMRGLRPMPTPWAVDADPEPLTPDGEALALLAGVRVFMLRWIYGHYEIDWRDETKYRLFPRSANQGFDVLSEHACGARHTWPHQKRQTPDPYVGRSYEPLPMKDDGNPPF